MLRASLRAVLFVLLACACLTAQAPAPELASRVKTGLEAATTLSKSLSDWALLTLAGSLLLILSTSYRRLKDRWRYLYLLLPAAWIALGLSLRSGLRLQQTVAAFHFTRPSDENAFRTLERVNESVAAQISSFEWALVLLGVWLTAYVIGLVFVGSQEIEG